MFQVIVTRLQVSGTKSGPLWRAFGGLHQFDLVGDPRQGLGHWQHHPRGALFFNLLRHPTLMNTMTQTDTFWLYAAFGTIGILFFFRVVPETKGRLLEDIEQMSSSQESSQSNRSAFQPGYSWRLLS